MWFFRRKWDILVGGKQPFGLLLAILEGSREDGGARGEAKRSERCGKRSGLTGGHDELVDLFERVARSGGG